MINAEKINVFLSRPNPFLNSHQLFLDQFQRLLDGYDISTVTLQAGDYDLSDSINYLKGMIRRCYGIVVIAFKQMYIESGYKKKDAVGNSHFFCSQEEDISGQALTSPFCHIEGAIGLDNDLPLLILTEDGVREEGIIKGGRFSIKVKPFSLQNMDAFFEDSTVRKQISVWVGRVADNFLFLNLNKV